MKKVTTLGAALGFLGLGIGALAQFTGGNLVVSVVKSSGATAPTNVANQRILREIKTDGSTTGTAADVLFPTVVSGANRRLTDSGTATSNGFINVSTDGKYILAAGYDAAVDSLAVAGTTSANVNRVIGRYDWSMTPALGLDTSTALTDAYSTNNFRAVVSVDGTAYWTAGSGTNPGVRYVTHGTVGTSTQLSTSVTNIRTIKIYNGQLYVSTSSGAFVGVNTVGTGLPTTSPQTITQLPGFNVLVGTGATQNASPYSFEFDGNNTVYVADDFTGAGVNNDPGLQKWVNNAGTWTKAVTYTIPDVAGTGKVGLRGLTRESSTVYYGTTTELTGQRVVKVVITGSNPTDVTVTTLATAAANEAIRDVKLLPVLNNSVSGTITFQAGLENVPKNQPLSITLTPIAPTTGSPINQTVTPDANGNYTTQPVPPGTYRLKVKTIYTLSEATDVNIATGNQTGVNFTLRGGDISSDNAVDITDLLALISAYNQAGAAATDINNDNVTDIGDLLILIGNYNQLGNN